MTVSPACHWRTVTAPRPEGRGFLLLRLRRARCPCYARALRKMCMVRGEFRNSGIGWQTEAETQPAMQARSRAGTLTKRRTDSPSGLKFQALVLGRRNLRTANLKLQRSETYRLRLWPGLPSSFRQACPRTISSTTRLNRFRAPSNRPNRWLGLPRDANPD